MMTEQDVSKILRSSRDHIQLDTPNKSSFKLGLTPNSALLLVFDTDKDEQEQSLNTPVL